MRSKESILFVINTVKTMSGASKVMSFVAESVTELFKKVYVVGIQDDNISNLIPNVEIIPLNVNTSYKGLWRLNAIRSLRKIFKSIEPDVVCAFVSDACVTAKLASIGLDFAFVSCERGDPYAFNSLWKYCVSKTYASSTRCVFQIPQARDYFGKDVAAKSSVIPNPFVYKATPITKKENRHKTIVSVGRLFEKQKHFSVLIKAFEIVHRTHPEYKLVIYGEGSSRSEYELLIEQLHLKEYVSLPGFVENTSEAIKYDGIFVLSSKYEGIPNTLIEAMSMGLPCVATDCSPGGANYLLGGGEYGALIKIDDIETMAQEIIQYIENPNLASRMGELAKDSIKRFMPGTIKDMWLDFFRSLKNN